MTEQEAPRYRLTNKFFGHGKFHQPGEEIIWRGEPNEVMEPLNAAANDKKTEFLAKIERTPRRQLIIEESE